MKKPIRFKRICKGLYMNHELGMAMSREAVWNTDEGRKWIATWKVVESGLFHSERTAKFDLMSEARAHLNKLRA